MVRIHRILRKLRPFARRVLPAGVLALQVCVATSTLWEVRSERRLGVHVEEDGTRHLDQHNEDACAVCSVRTHTSLPSTLAQLPSGADASDPVRVAGRTGAAVVHASATRSRAPPVHPG